MSLTNEKQENLFRADLHCHTTCSDGTFTPYEIIQEAVKVGLSGMSITDHDTMQAYENIFSYAHEMGIKLLPGIEFSAFHQEESVHILGYGFQIDHPVIINLCDKHLERRKNRNLAILERMQQHKLNISIEDIVVENGNRGLERAGRPHFARALQKKGYVASISEAFIRYLGNSSPCYVHGSFITVQDTIDAIRSAKGKVILAHPYVYNYQFCYEIIRDFDFDGIEVYYGNTLPHLENTWKKAAEKRSMLMTGGSDFHGAMKPNLCLGASWTPEITFQHLYEIAKQNNPNVLFF